MAEAFLELAGRCMDWELGSWQSEADNSAGGGGVTTGSTPLGFRPSPPHSQVPVVMVNHAD